MGSLQCAFPLGGKRLLVFRGQDKDEDEDEEDSRAHSIQSDPTQRVPPRKENAGQGGLSPKSCWETRYTLKLGCGSPLVSLQNRFKLGASKKEASPHFNSQVMPHAPRKDKDEKE